MYEVVFIAESGKRVIKSFTEYPAARKFYFRCVHSKRVKLVSINFDPYK